MIILPYKPNLIYPRRFLPCFSFYNLYPNSPLSLSHERGNDGEFQIPPKRVVRLGTQTNEMVAEPMFMANGVICRNQGSALPVLANGKVARVKARCATPRFAS
jgi:hypothetical protein